MRFITKNEVAACEICDKQFDDDAYRLSNLNQPPDWAVREVYEEEDLSGSALVCEVCWEKKIHPAAWRLAEEEEAEQSPAA